MRGRWYLMQALLLIEQYSVTMPLEFLRLKKGDKIRVLRPEVLYGIGSAALAAWTLDDAGNVTAIRWDAELQMTPGQRYAAIVRLGDGSEWTVTGTSDDGRTMRIDDPLPAPCPLPEKPTWLWWAPSTMWEGCALSPALSRETTLPQPSGCVTTLRNCIRKMVKFLIIRPRSRFPVQGHFA